MIHIKIDAEGWVTAVSESYCLGEDELIIEAPDGFIANEHWKWRMVGGALEKLEESPEEDAPTIEQRMEALEGALLALTLGGGTVARVSDPS